jgi:hypothetical protein
MFTDVTAATSTALKALFSRIDAQSGGSAAVLPRGFGLRWNANDHHVLQAAHDLGPPSRFLEAGRFYLEGLPDVDTSQVSSRAITWVAQFILKDNARVRGYDTAQLVSIVTGGDVGFVVPPFAVLPLEDPGPFAGCIVLPRGEQMRDIVIREVPFEYAFPVLTGWNLNFGCDDQHVSRIGIHIDSPSYAPATPGGGTLRYRVRSILADRDGEPGHSMSHRIAILGFVATAGRPRQADAGKAGLVDIPNRHNP